MPKHSAPAAVKIRNTVVYSLIGLLVFSTFGVSVLLLNRSIGDFEDLSAERQAGLAASAVWEYLSLGEPPFPNGYRDYDQQRGASSGTQNFGPPGMPSNTEIDERQRTMLTSLFQSLGELSEKMRDPDQDQGPAGMQGTEGPSAADISGIYISRINGLVILGRRGDIVAQAGDESFKDISFDDLLRQSKTLPFGDRAFKAANGDLLYLRNAGVRLRQMPGGRSPERWLIVSYDTGDIRSDANLRRLLLFGLSAAGLVLLAGTVFFYTRTRNLRVQNARQETLARLGLAARTLAHEIRNPLSVIVMQKTMLQKSLGEQYSGELKRIERESERISNLTRKVKDMLDKPAGQPRALAVAESMAALLDGNTSWQERVETAGPRELAVFADPEHFRTIMGNLVDNALRQHDAAGVTRPIRVVWQKVKKQVLIQVRDWGGGVPRDIQHKIFDAFFSTRAEGSGVGLSLSRSLAVAAGGSLEFRNHTTEGVMGAEFSLTLALAEDSQ